MLSRCCQLCFTLIVMTEYRVPIVDIGVRHSIASPNRHSVNSWRDISFESYLMRAFQVQMVFRATCMSAYNTQSTVEPHATLDKAPLYNKQPKKNPVKEFILLHYLTPSIPCFPIALLVYNAPSHYTVYHYRYPTCAALQSLFASYSSKYRFRYPQAQQSSS